MYPKVVQSTDLDELSPSTLVSSSGSVAKLLWENFKKTPKISVCRINSDPSKFEKIDFSKIAFKKFGLRMQHFRRQIWEIRGVLKRSRRDLSIGDIFSKLQTDYCGGNDGCLLWSIWLEFQRIQAHRNSSGGCPSYLKPAAGEKIEFRAFWSF